MEGVGDGAVLPIVGVLCIRSASMIYIIIKYEFYGMAWLSKISVHV